MLREVCHSSTLANWSLNQFVDLGGIEPPSEQLILWHAKILLVNSTMISRRIRFKAISGFSDAFSMLLWVANPLKHVKRSERLEISLIFSILPWLTLRFSQNILAFLIYNAVSGSLLSIPPVAPAQGSHIVVVDLMAAYYYTVLTVSVLHTWLKGSCDKC